MKLILIRHCQSKQNNSEVHQSRDTALSEKGIEQAKSLASQLKQLSFDSMFSSDLARAVETAEIISSYLDIKYEVMSLFQEMASPSEIEGKSIYDDSVHIVINEISKDWNNPGYHYSNEENPREFLDRIEEIIKFIQNLNKQAVLVITHEKVIKTLVGKIFLKEGLETKDLGKFWKSLQFDNGGICEINLNKGEWRLITWNSRYTNV